MAVAPRYYQYTVQPGDSMISIVQKAYGWTPPSRRYGELRDLLVRLNPHVRNPDRPMPWETMCLANDPSVYPGTDIPRPLQFVSADTSPREREAYWALSWLEHNSNWLTNPGSVAAGATQHLLGRGNVGLIEEVGQLYARYKAGAITKGMYGAGRRRLLAQFQSNVGSLERLLLRGQTANEAIRIARAGGVPHTANIAMHASRLRRLASLASKGGLLLTGVGAVAGCMQMADTTNRKEKNEILVETVASTATSLLLGILVVSGPVGWGAALVLATSSAAASYFIGKGASAVYDRWGNQADLAGASGIERLCSR